MARLGIYPLSRIHNTSLINAHFGLDSRERKCLEYYIRILNSFIKLNFNQLANVKLKPRKRCVF
jgi:hypothetical protein